MKTAHELIRSWPSTMDSVPDADKMNEMRRLCISIQDERDALRARVKEAETTVLQLVRENGQLREALIAAEKYMTRQRAKTLAPFDPEALKQARAALKGENT